MTLEQSQVLGPVNAKLRELEDRVTAIEKWREPVRLSVNDGTLTLRSSFTQANSSTEPVLALRFGDNRCRLHGQLNASATTGVSAFYLPPDWAPRYRQVRPAWRSADLTTPNNYVEVLTTGEVRVYNADGATQIDLDCMEWVAGQ